jgi:hypothetical protein
MSIIWAQYAAVMEEKIGMLSEAEKYRYWVTNLIGTPYRWGEEGPLGTDCSGTISFALWMMGYDLRTTADAFLHKIFTIEKDWYDDKYAQAVFYLTREEQRHGDRVVPAKYAVHVTPLVGQGVVVNAGDFVTVNRQESIEGWFRTHQNADPVIRAIDWGEARQLSQRGSEAWGVDPLLLGLRS